MNLRTPFLSFGIIATTTTTRTLLKSSLLFASTSQAFQLMSTMSSSSSSSSLSSTKSILYDVPVSNNGARCRLILYKKQITSSQVEIVSPMTIAEKGLKSPEYLQRNPQGKMPLLSIATTTGTGTGTGDNDDDDKSIMNIPESDTICRYLLSTYADQGPSFLPNHTKSNLIARLHDMYMTTIQGCLYKPTPPFGIYGTRSDALEEYIHQMNIINDLLDDKCGTSADIGTGTGTGTGTVASFHYLCGKEVSLADATLFPSIVFAEKMLPKFGFENAIPDKLARWYDQVKVKDEDFAKIYEEVCIIVVVLHNIIIYYSYLQFIV